MNTAPNPDEELNHILGYCDCSIVDDDCFYAKTVRYNPKLSKHEIDQLVIAALKSREERLVREARIDEIELDAAKRAYATNLGASEFEAFLTPEQRKRITAL